MNDNKVVAGVTKENTIQEVKEVKPPMNLDLDKFLADTEKAIKESASYKEELPEDPKERARFFLNKSKENVMKSITYNNKIEWTERERKVFDELKEIAVALVQKTNELVENIPLQEKGLEKIEQQLADKPIADIKLQTAGGDNFSIIKVSTGKIIATGNAEVIKGVLNGLYIAQQG